MAVKVATLDEVLQAVQSLTKVVGDKKKSSCRRFPYLCRNGIKCQWLACGSCWFQHEAPKKQGKNIQLPEESDYKNTNTVQAFETQMAKVQATVEKKMEELSNYVDRRLACLEARVGDILEEASELSIKPESDVDNKFDKHVVDKIKVLVERLDKRTDEKLERFVTMCMEKVEGLTNRLVEGAMGALNRSACS